MGVLTSELERVADGVEEGCSQPNYQVWRSVYLLFAVLFISLHYSFRDPSVVERARRMVPKKLTGELVTSISKSYLLLTQALCEFLIVLDRNIRWLPTAAKRDHLHRSVGPSIFFEREQCSVGKKFRSRSHGVWEGKPMPDSMKEDVSWDSLPDDIQENVLHRLDFQTLFRLKTVSNTWKKFIESDNFREWRGAKSSEGEFTAINYYIKNKSWRCSGYDLHSRSWRSLPPLSYLPPPDAELFKEFLVCGHGALMCADVSQLPNKVDLVVFNPLTGKTRALPPLLYPRNPVLLHICVESLQKFYKVIVAGSTASSPDWRKPNCKIMEVFDSSTSKWKETCVIPGPSFGLSKHQTGVSVNGILFFISYLDATYRHPRGDYVLAWDMENSRYLKNWVCPIPFAPDSKSLLQLIENDGKVYLFSEFEGDDLGQCVQGLGIVWHRIDEMQLLDRDDPGAAACRWRHVVQVRKTGSVQEIRMHPAFRRGVADSLCVGFGKGKLCIFNTLDRNGVVYETRDGTQCEVLEPPPAHLTGDKAVFSLNPASFTLHPSFARDP